MPSWMTSSPRLRPRMPGAAGSVTSLAGRDRARAEPERLPGVRAGPARAAPPRMATSAHRLNAADWPARRALVAG
jgi:hypothetical protein